MHNRTKFLRVALVLLIGLFLSSIIFAVNAGRFIAETYDRNERLWAAAAYGDTPTVQTLLRQGADPNYTDAGQTILRNAVFSRNPETVKAVLCAGADTQSKGDALQQAKAQNDTAMIRLLQQSGATE